jgi:hypothetical protein
MVVRDELGRYLEPCVGHLLEFCDEVALLDDGSGDGLTKAAQRWPRVRYLPGGGVGPAVPAGFVHEGRTRQMLLDWTLEQEPTHVLSIDADEFVEDGPRVRALLEADPNVPVWSLLMEEVWELDGDCLCVREDGGWRPHQAPILYRAPTAQQRAQAAWRIADRRLACGREPAAVRQTRFRATGASVLHFGWANRAEREARHARYAVADGGAFHQSKHLDSILWPDHKVRLEGRPWPASLAAWRGRIAARA